MQPTGEGHLLKYSRYSKKDLRRFGHGQRFHGSAPASGHSGRKIAAGRGQSGWSYGPSVEYLPGLSRDFDFFDFISEWDGIVG